MIPIFLSQLHRVPGDFVLFWVIVALSFLAALALVVGIWSNLRSRPPHETPTRREFDSLSKKVSEIESALPPMERRLLDALENMSDRVTAKIEKLADADHEERVAIWNQFNKENKAVGERVARLEAKAKP